jgi:ABC-type uncharacterized transport system involved in gliding motility auxiliary subunit
VNALRSYSGPAGLIILAAGAGLLRFLPDHRMWAYVLLAVGGVLTVAAAALNLEDLLNVMKGRTVRYGANAVFYSLIVFGIVVGANILAARHNKRFDLTETGAFTLAPQTVKVLKGLDNDVEVLAFYTEMKNQRQRFEDLSSEYRYHTPHLKVRLVDPMTSPGEARRYEITQDGTVVVLTEAGEARITTLGEEELTNAIVKATRKDKKVVCFTKGHGEGSIEESKAPGYNQAAEALRKESYEVKDVLLLQAPDVPSECNVLVIAGPQSALMPAEVEAAGRYLKAGGRALILKKDPTRDTGLDDLLASYGLKTGRNIIVDRLSNAMFGDAFVPVVLTYEADHPVTKELAENRIASLFVFASGVETTNPSDAGITSRIVARTSPNAWGETDLESQALAFEEGKDLAGPVGVMGAASGKVGGSAAPADPNVAADPNAPAEKEARVVLVGDSDFASNAYLGTQANADLFLNSVAWLTEESDLISVRSKEKKPQPITLTRGKSNLLTAMTYFTPLATVVLGVGIWVRRKRL